MNTETVYLLGLDLGQKRDPTALVILERHGRGRDALFHARHIQRYPIGTSYPSIITDVSGKLAQLPASTNQPTLAIDETAVGMPVIDLFKRAKLKAHLKPIHITGGATVTTEDSITSVPKRDLVSVVQVALQTDRLKIAAALPEASLLVQELQNFQVKEAANDTQSVWREAAHDDLVLSVAMALWQGTQQGGRLVTW